MQQGSKFTSFGVHGGNPLATPPVAPAIPTPPNVGGSTAQGLDRRRGWLLGLPEYAPLPNVGDALPTIIAVGGGKGGVGKSLLSANLAAKLAKVGAKVLVVDLDIGGANLHTYFGLSASGVTLADYALQRRSSIHEVTLDTSVSGVRFVAGAREEFWGRDGSIDRNAVVRIWQGILNARAQTGYDFVLLDLGAGTHNHTIDFFCAAHLGVITVLPEPTSIENAYVFLKSMLWREMQAVGARLMMNAEADALRQHLAMSDGQGFQVRGYFDRIRAMEARYPAFISGLYAALAARICGIVVNQTRSQQDIDIGRSMELIAARYFGLTSVYLGNLNYDEAAWKSLRNRRLLSVDFAQSTLSRHLSEVAQKALQSLGFRV